MKRDLDMPIGARAGPVPWGGFCATPLSDFSLSHCSPPVSINPASVHQHYSLRRFHPGLTERSGNPKSTISFFPPPILLWSSPNRLHPPSTAFLLSSNPSPICNLCHNWTRDSGSASLNQPASKMYMRCVISFIYNMGEPSTVQDRGDGGTQDGRRLP